MVDDFIFNVSYNMWGLVCWFFGGHKVGGFKVNIILKILYTFMGIVFTIVMSPVLLLVFIIEAIISGCRKIFKHK